MGYVGNHGEALTSDQLRFALEQGQLFHATTGKITNAAAGNFPLALFVPANTTKNILITKIRVIDAGGNNPAELRLITANPAWASPAIINNMNFASAVASVLGVANITFASATQAVAGTVYEVYQAANNTELDMLSPGVEALFFPANNPTGAGIEVWIEPSQAGSVSISIEWWEY